MVAGREEGEGRKEAFRMARFKTLFAYTYRGESRATGHESFSQTYLNSLPWVTKHLVCRHQDMLSIFNSKHKTLTSFFIFNRW